MGGRWPALSLLLFGAAVWATDHAEDVGCPELAGVFEVDGANATIRVLNGSSVLGDWGEPGRPGFSGLLTGNCFGTAIFPGGVEYAFRYYAGTIAWSSGKSWRKLHFHAPVTVREDERDTKVTVTVATMLFGMLIVGVGLLYLVNYPDENIRYSVYGMISVTMSVFVAVLVNQAMFTFCVMQIMAAPFPRGLGLQVTEPRKMFIGLILLIALWVTLGVSSWRLRENKRLLYTSTHIGAHLVAFAGIHCFSALARSGHHGGDGSYGLTIIAILLAYASLRFARWASNQVRVTLLSDLAEVSLVEKLEPEDDDSLVNRFMRCKWVLAEHHAIEECREAEEEAIVLIISYLMNQLLCQVLLNRLPDIHGHESGLIWDDVEWMGIFALASFALLCGTVIVIQRAVKSRRARAVSRGKAVFMLKILAMSMSWCLQLAAAWGMQLIFSGIQNVTIELTAVINAFFVSVASILVIMLLDSIADKVEAQDKRRRKPRSGSAFEALVEAPKRTGTGMSGLSGVSVDRTKSEAGRSENSSTLASPPPSLTRHPSDGPRQAALSDFDLDPREFASVLRVIIDSFGLLVALAWDRAFDAADETIVEGIGQHPVIAKVLLAVLLVCFVAPAWSKYIVPKAMRTESEHLQQIVQEELEESRGRPCRQRSGHQRCQEDSHSNSPRDEGSEMMSDSSDELEGRQRE